MDIDDIKVDSKKIEDGEWVSGLPGMGDLQIKTRGVGNSDWKKLNKKLIEALPVERRLNGVISDDDVDEINTQLLVQSGVQDWKNLTQAKAVVEFSKEKLDEYLRNPDMRRFRDMVMIAASTVGTRRLLNVESAVKN